MSLGFFAVVNIDSSTEGSEDGGGRGEERLRKCMVGHSSGGKDSLYHINPVLYKRLVLTGSTNYRILSVRNICTPLYHKRFCHHLQHYIPLFYAHSAHAIFTLQGYYPMEMIKSTVDGMEDFFFLLYPQFLSILSLKVNSTSMNLHDFSFNSAMKLTVASFR